MGTRNSMLVKVLIGLIVLIPAAEAKAAPAYPEAVLLVSGFQTETPFSTPATECNGQEGSEWNPPGYPAGSAPEGIAPVLKGGGSKVFTAPVTKTGTPLPPSCAGPGEPLPDFNTMVINSNGDTDANGAALARLIGFLRDNYGVDELRIVGHSDGGLWSRSAITQDSAYTSVDIQNLTTLGTPHTGSYLADLAIELKGGKCDFSNRTEQAICDLVVPLANLVVKKLGTAATFQLTNDFLATWNPRQSIGNCPVSAIAGDHVNFGIPFFEYYTPSDGLVGLASAQARDAIDVNGHLIPAPEIADLREAGVYDVVHGASLSLLSGKTLLNQAQISQQVANTIQLTGSESCNEPPASFTAGADTSPDAAGPVQRLRAPLYRMIPADRSGRLPKPGSEDFAISGQGVSIRCGFEALKPIPLLGDRRLRIHHPRGCSSGLRVRNGSGKGVPRALMLRSNPNRHVWMRVDGERALIRIRGRAPRSARAQFLKNGTWKTLATDDRGWAKLPKTSGNSLSLRIRTRGHTRGAPADTAHINIVR